MSFISFIFTIYIHCLKRPTPSRFVLLFGEFHIFFCLEVVSISFVRYFNWWILEEIFFLIKKNQLFTFDLKFLLCKWKKINLIIFYLFTLVCTWMQSAHVRFTCKKKNVVPDRCQRDVSPYQGMIYNIIHLPPSVLANQMRSYSQN